MRSKKNDSPRAIQAQVSPAKIRNAVLRSKHPNKATVDCLESAFAYSEEVKADIAKAILSVANLLDFSSEGGNRSVNGATARGLSEALRLSAREVQLYMHTVDEIRSDGSDAKDRS